MQCLTEPEIATWLADNCVTAKPYDQVDSPVHYLQFKCPMRSLGIASFVRQFLIPAAGEVLVHITDWPTYQQSEMLVINAIRRNSNESRGLIDVPGHLIPECERELAIAVFSHATMFEWNAYMYLPNDIGTIYIWEGELFDFWSNDSATYHRVARLVDDFALRRKDVG